MTSNNIEPKDQWLNQSIKYFKQGRYQEALSACEQSLWLDPNFSRAYHGQGLILMYLKRYQEAVGSFQRAVQLCSDKAKIHVDLGQVFLYWGVIQSQEMLIDALFSLIQGMPKPILIRQKH